MKSMKLLKNKSSHLLNSCGFENKISYATDQDPFKATSD